MKILLRLKKPAAHTTSERSMALVVVPGQASQGGHAQYWCIMFKGKDFCALPVLQRTWMLHQIPMAIILYMLGGWSWVVWGVFVRVAVCFTMHWYIAHIAHTDGPQDWSVDDAAIQGFNVPWLAIPSVY